jgi:hypothetical protein
MIIIGVIVLLGAFFFIPYTAVSSFPQSEEIA